VFFVLQVFVSIVEGESQLLYVVRIAVRLQRFAEHHDSVHGRFVYPLYLLWDVFHDNTHKYNNNNISTECRRFRENPTGTYYYYYYFIRHALYIMIPIYIIMISCLNVSPSLYVSVRTAIFRLLKNVRAISTQSLNYRYQWIRFWIFWFAFSRILRDFSEF